MAPSWKGLKLWTHFYNSDHHTETKYMHEYMEELDDEVAITMVTNTPVYGLQGNNKLTFRPHLQKITRVFTLHISYS